MRALRILSGFKIGLYNELLLKVRSRNLSLSAGSRRRREHGTTRKVAAISAHNGTHAECSAPEIST